MYGERELAMRVGALPCTTRSGSFQSACPNKRSREWCFNQVVASWTCLHMAVQSLEVAVSGL